MEANPILLQNKYSRVIHTFSKKENLSLNEALDIFYKSELYELMSEGISDFHCLSDEYLAEELCLEMSKL